MMLMRETRSFPIKVSYEELFNIVIEVLVHAIIQDKGIQGKQIGKEEIKLSLFIDDMIIHVRNLKESTKKLLLLVIDYRKLQDRRLTYLL